MQFVNILIRQGHPGPAVQPYTSDHDKLRDAVAHQREDRIPWPVIVDDIGGSVHRQYGMLADPTYLIDANGRVAFYNAITHAPTLHRALRELSARGWRGVVLDGADRRPHMLSTLVGGWPALRRGLPQSAIDLETALPTGALLPFIGYQLRCILAPIALRSEPLPRRSRLMLMVVAAAAAGLALGLTRRTNKTRLRAEHARVRFRH